jgi:predicted nucleic acid-binding protein
MAFLLDTNVLSEVVKKNPNRNVVGWFDATDEYEQYVSVFSIGEIQKGISKHDASRRKSELQLWFDRVITRYRERILPFRLETATVWGRLVADLERRGRILPIIDSFIAAIALEHDLTIVTQNIADFAPTKAKVLNIWI